MIGIEFVKHGFVSGNARCPMCRSHDRSDLLTIDSVSSSLDKLHMAMCENCGSAYFLDENPVSGYDQEGFDDSYWVNYVHSGAGISAMLEPILAFDKHRGKRLLDIGSGFGFVPHFWEKMMGGEAIGLEMSNYGRIGSQKLGIKNVPKYYSQAEELHGQSFELVYSSEVLEHVEDPKIFVNEISAALSEDGILILTTPSASILKPTTDYLLLLATLSPGFHYFIASAESLRTLLSNCGFEHVVVHDSGHRLFAWASKKQLPNIRHGFSDWPIYLEYLDKLSENEDHHISSGALYRSMKDSYNLGMFESANRSYQRFKVLAKNKFDFDFDNIEISLPRLRERTQLDSESYPSWTGCALLYAGLLEGWNKGSLEVQKSLLSASIEAMQKEIDLSPRFAGESSIFIGKAKQAHSDIFEMSVALGSFKHDPSEVFILRHPGSLVGRDVCIFAAYSSHLRLTDAVVDYIDLLVENGIVVVLCLAIDDPTQNFDLSNIPVAAGLIIRKNGGFDFCTWSSALRILPELWGAERLFLVNDSVFVLPSLLPKFLNSVAGETADFVGVTESFQQTHHSQSYFSMFQGRALSHSGLRDYLSTIRPLENKIEVIQKYELTLFSRVKDDFGLSTKIMYPMSDLFPAAREEEFGKLNVTHTYWDYLVSRGLPFVKVELLRDNPINSNILHWRYIFNQFGGSVAKVLQHISTPRVGRMCDSTEQYSKVKGKRPKAKKPHSERSNLQLILSDLNRVRLNARRRRRERRSQK